jgi:hypothetical protein
MVASEDPDDVSPSELSVASDGDRDELPSAPAPLSRLPLSGPCGLEELVSPVPQATTSTVSIATR